MTSPHNNRGALRWRSCIHPLHGEAKPHRSAPYNPLRIVASEGAPIADAPRRLDDATFRLRRWATRLTARSHL